MPDKCPAYPLTHSKHLEGHDDSAVHTLQIKLLLLFQHQNLSHFTAGHKRLSGLTSTCILQDSLGVTTAPVPLPQANQVHGKE